MTREDPYKASGEALARQHRTSAPSVLKDLNSYFTAQDRISWLGKFIRGGLEPRALVRFLVQDLSTNSALRECSRESLYLGLLACAMTGLEPGPLKGHAYLVPYARKATFIAGYKGIIVQARRSRVVTSITANVVYENDVFDIDLGSANRVVHKPKLVAAERGKVIGAYAIATLVPPSYEGREVIDIESDGRARRGVGFQEIEWMDITDLDKVRNVSEAKSRRDDSPWKVWTTEMQRKTVIRRLGKRLPLGEDYFRALALDKPHDEGRGDDAAIEQRKILDAETDGEASKMVDAIVPGKTDEMTDDEKREVERLEREQAAGER